MSGDGRFSQPDLDQNFLAKYEKESLALDPAYDLTNLFLDSVLSTNILPESVISAFDLDNIDPFLQALLDNWDEVLAENWRLLTALIFGVLMAFIMLIIGIIWCSFKCCSKSEERPRMSGDKLSICCQGSIFFVLMLLCWTCATWSLGAGIYGQIQTDQLGKRLGWSVHDAGLYLNNTLDQATYLAEKNFDELEIYFNEEVDVSVSRFDDIIVKITNGTDDLDFSFYELVNLVGFLSTASREFNDRFKNITDKLSELEGAALILEETMKEIKGDPLTEILNDPNICPNDFDGCTDLNSSKENLDVDPNSIPDVLPISLPPNAATDLHSLYEALQGGLDVINDLSKKFVNESVKDLQAALEEVGIEIKDAVVQIRQELDELRIDNWDEDIGNDIDDAIGDWDTIAFNVMFIPVDVCLFVLMLYGLGFLLGSIGKADSGTKRVGSFCLNMGTTIFFIFVLIMWIWCVALFIGGALSQQLACTTLENPSDSELYPALERELNEWIHEALDDESFKNVNWSLPEFLESCENNNGIYYTLHLENLYDVSDLLEWDTEIVDINETVNEANRVISEVIDDAVTQATLKPEEEEILRNVSEILGSQLEEQLFDKFDKYDPVSTFNETLFEEFSTGVQELNTYINGTNDTDLAEKMEKVMGQLDNMTKAALEFNSTLHETLELVRTYEADLDYGNELDLAENGERAINMSQEIVAYLDGPGEQEILGTLNMSVLGLVDEIDEYVAFSVSTVEQDLGACRPLYNAYFGVIRSTCWKIIEPINALWAGLGLLLLLFIPVLILSNNLAKLYKAKKMSLEVNSVIFVNSTGGKKRKKKKGKKMDPLATAVNPMFAPTPAEIPDLPHPSASNERKQHQKSYTLTPGETGVSPVPDGRHRIYNPADFFPGYERSKIYEVPEVYKIPRSQSFSA